MCDKFVNSFCRFNGVNFIMMTITQSKDNALQSNTLCITFELAVVLSCSGRIPYTLCTKTQLQLIYRGFVFHTELSILYNIDWLSSVLHRVQAI